jgi:hypothetical protein
LCTEKTYIEMELSPINEVTECQNILVCRTVIGIRDCPTGGMTPSPVVL